MFDMKRKTLAALAGGLGAISLLAVVEKERRLRKAEANRLELIQLVRQTLSQEGKIAVLYVNAFDKLSLGLTGGVVMEDGRNFSFAYVGDSLQYQEVEA